MLHHFAKRYKEKWAHVGQLRERERQFVQEAIWRSKPEVVLEIGTRYGNGTTIEIANSLKSLNRGHLHTCEVNHEAYVEAIFYLNGCGVSDFVTCHHIGAKRLINNMIESSNFPDFWMFDGPENAQLNLTLFCMLEQLNRVKT